MTATRSNELLGTRTDANRDFFEADAERLAVCCRRMADAFASGGRLLALGASPQAASDAHHVAVEFVHPVIVGKRALPAIALVAEGGPLGDQVRTLACPGDIVMAFGWLPDELPLVGSALAAAAERDCLTVSFARGEFGEPADFAFDPPVEDPLVAQEVVETAYHVLWELVHVFFEHRSPEPEVGPAAGAGAASFLYPFLAGSPGDEAALLDDVRRSVLAKAEDVGRLRERTMADCAAEITAAATTLRSALDAGGRLLAFGNGGSATDAMDLAADMRHPPGAWGGDVPAGWDGWRCRPALDLGADASILTAVANDVGVAEIFQRQVIAHGRAGDVALAFSTSGGSANVIAALAEARRRRMATIALVGHDGGAVVAEGLADHIVLCESEHIPRIQEAQASVYHALRELIEDDAAAEAG